MQNHKTSSTEYKYLLVFLLSMLLSLNPSSSQVIVQVIVSIQFFSGKVYGVLMFDVHSISQQLRTVSFTCLFPMPFPLDTINI
jgi:hypothetical protein